MGINLDGFIGVLIMFGVIIGLFLWGLWGSIDYFFIDDSIRVETPLVPIIEVITIDGVSDTTYVYNID